MGHQHSIHQTVIKSVLLTNADLTEMRKTDCFGETRLVPHVPSSPRAGKRFYYYYCYYYYCCCCCYHCYNYSYCCCCYDDYNRYSYYSYSYSYYSCCYFYNYYYIIFIIIIIIVVSNTGKAHLEPQAQPTGTSPPPSPPKTMLAGTAQLSLEMLKRTDAQTEVTEIRIM